jgi:hypothetical protein
MPFQVGNLYYIYCSFINPPHEKICLCVCAQSPYFFWVNSHPRVHGIAQVALATGISNGINHDSYADLSGVKTAAPHDLARARDFGPMSQDALALIKAGLQQPNRMLPEAHRALALANLP